MGGGICHDMSVSSGTMAIAGSRSSHNREGTVPPEQRQGANQLRFVVTCLFHWHQVFVCNHRPPPD